MRITRDQNYSAMENSKFSCCTLQKLDTIMQLSCRSSLEWLINLLWWFIIKDHQKIFEKVIKFKKSQKTGTMAPLGRPKRWCEN